MGTAGPEALALALDSSLGAADFRVRLEQLGAKHAPVEALCARLLAIVRRYYYMSDNVYDIASVDWSEDPDPAVHLLRQKIRAAHDDASSPAPPSTQAAAGVEPAEMQRLASMADSLPSGDMLLHQLRLQVRPRTTAGNNFNNLPLFLSFFFLLFLFLFLFLFLSFFLFSFFLFFFSFLGLGRVRSVSCWAARQRSGWRT